MTIEFRGEFYQMVREEPGEKPRRFTYYLQKNPVGRVVVKIDHYNVDDVMKAPPPKESALRQMKDDARSKIKELKERKTPPVEDLLLRGGARQGYDLKIYSC